MTKVTDPNKILKIVAQKILDGKYDYTSTNSIRIYLTNTLADGIVISSIEIDWKVNIGGKIEC